VTGAAGDGLAAIRRRARRLGVHLEEVAPLAVRRMDRRGLWLHDEVLGDFRLALLGRHQAANAAVALAVLRALGRAGLADVPAAAVRSGCAAVHWPGRLELLPPPRGPAVGLEVVLDGAHNAAGAAALAAALDEIRPSLSPGRPTLLLGMMADKQIDRIVRVLAGSTALAGAHVVTTAVDVPRALAAEVLATAWGSVASVPAEPVASPEAALSRALDAARAAGGPLIVAGSLYLVGEIRGLLLPADRP
jgi:dihydrofolate synthase/folylpolyglutamate synthase